MRKRAVTFPPEAAMQRSGAVMDQRSLRENAEMRDGSLGVDSSFGTETSTRMRQRMSLDKRL
jgi:hypothetical protein